VANGGTPSAAILNFGLPGAATFAVGTVTGLPAGSPPTVTNVGTPLATILDFGIPAGANGTNGINAFTTLTNSYVQPTPVGLTTITVGSTDWMVVGQWLYVATGGWYTVNTIFSPTTVSIQNNGTIGNAAAGVIINAGGGINAAGPLGPPGPPGGAGGAGHTPIWFSGTGSPSSGTGVDGDVYLQQVNGGRWQIYVKVGGFWAALAFGQITSSRQLFVSTTNPDPNTMGLTGVNTNDYGWTAIGSTITYWVFNGTTWIAGFTFTTGGGGGGGTDTFTTVAANSVAGAFGQLTGSYNWMLERTMFLSPVTVTHNTIWGTVQFDLRRPKTILNLNADVVLNHTTLGGDGEWVFEIVNTSATTRSIVYSSGVWTVLPGVAQPDTITPGDTVQLICRVFKAKICITQVIANASTI